MSVSDPARSFDRVAAEYERVRPDYPEALLDLLPLGADSSVLDLGAGTGKLTRLLVGRYAHVTAVEPLENMRRVLESMVPEAESLPGAAESIPLDDASVDGVFAGQAFHWFANDTAVSEIARVLRPGGVLCLAWNEPEEPLPLPADYVAYLARLHAPALEAVRNAPPWSELIARGPFGEVHETAVPHEQVQDREEVLTFAQTVSWVAHRPEAERARIAADLDRMLGEGPFTFPLRTNVTWAVRT
jgi:ubiquinone/menaquinone biosynthesis C-methylase UbiE